MFVLRDAGRAMGIAFELELKAANGPNFERNCRA